MTMTAEQQPQLREVAINKMAMRQKARAASAGAWIKESGDGWEAVCSSDGQANGGFIIAHFEGPDAAANREFMQAATPDAVLALLDELETKEDQRANWFRMAQKLGEDLDAIEKLVAEQREYYEGVIADGSKRIAELEARTVTVKLPSLKQTESGERYVWSDGVHNFKSDVIEVLRAAGVTVEG